MTKSCRPDPKSPPPQGEKHEEVFARLSEGVDEHLPGILREIDGAAALLAEILSRRITKRISPFWVRVYRCRLKKVHCPTGWPFLSACAWR